MIKLPITLLFTTISILGTASDVKLIEDSKINTELSVNATAKSPSEILVGGSWNNPNAAMSEDVIFNAGGQMLWRSGEDEGEDIWEIKEIDILHFYGRDYKIVELTESKLVVSENGEHTTYERNESSDCNPQFKIEGMNDAKGEYKIDNESWTIHFGEEDFIAFHTYNGNQGDPAALVEIVTLSNCEYGIMLDTDEGENASSMTLIYNETEKYYDLHISSYDPETDSWYVKIFNGNSDNG